MLTTTKAVAKGPKPVLVASERATIPEEAIVVEVSDDPIQNVQVAKNKRGTLKKAASALRANQFVDLVKGGMSQELAAAAVHRSVSELHKDRDVMALVDNLVETYTLTPEKRRKLVRAKQTEIMLFAEDPKVQLDASKAIAGDVEIGISGPGIGVQVNVNQQFSDDTKKLFDDIEFIDITPDPQKESVPPAAEETSSDRS